MKKKIFIIAMLFSLLASTVIVNAASENPGGTPPLRSAKIVSMHSDPGGTPPLKVTKLYMDPGGTPPLK